jgi:hypothetical protein
MPGNTTAGLMDHHEENKRLVRDAKNNLREAEESTHPREVCDVGPFLEWLRNKKDLKDLRDLTGSSHNEKDPANAFWNSLEFIRKYCGNVELKEWKKLKPHHTLKNYGFIWLQFSGFSS